MDPFSAAISIIGIGSNVANGINSMNAGKAANTQAKMQAEDIRIQGMQRDTARLEDYYATIGSIETIRAGRNLSLDSKTGEAIDKSLSVELRRNRQNEMGSYSRQRSQTLLSGKIAQQQANAKAVGFFGEAATGAFSLGQSLMTGKG
jgi:hypothetical protein